MNYRITYTDVDGDEHSMRLVGPHDSEESDCHSPLVDVPWYQASREDST